MRVGVVSDTHDNVDAVKGAVEVFEDRGTEKVIHAGDFVAPPSVEFFEGFELHGVLGNNDGEVAGLRGVFDSLGSGSELHGRFAEVGFGDSDFAVLHGESKEEVDAVSRGDYDYVVYGHHHEKEVREVGDTVVVNPGAHFPTVPSDERTVAVVDTEAEGVESVEFVEL